MQKKQIIIDVQTEDGVKSLNRLETSFEDVYGEIQPLSGRLGELEDQLYEMANAGDTSSDAFKALSAEVGRMKKVIVEVDLEVDALSMTASQKLGGALTGVTAGFELVQGAMGAMGAESEKVQEALLKVQSAMAIAQGVQGLKEAVPAFKAFGKSAINALQGIKGAVAATGIGLLVIAIGTLVGYWDDIKESISGVSAEQDRLNRATQRYADIANESLETFSKNEEILRLQGKTEKEILKLKIAQTDEAIKATEISIKQAEETLKSQVAAEKRNKAILKGIIQFITAPLQLLLATIDKVAEFAGVDSNLQDSLNDWTAELLFDPKEVEKNGLAAINEQKKALEQLKTDRVKYNLQIDNIEKEETRKRVEEAKKRNEELKKEYDDFVRDQKALNKEIQDSWTLGADKGGLLPPPEIIEDNLDQIVDITAEKFSAMETIQMNWSNNFMDTFNRTTGFASDALGAIQELTEAFAGKSEASQRKAFKIRKAAAIAQATIETYRAAQSAYASQIIPGDPSSPIRGAIAATIAVASGLAKVKSIASQKFEGGGSASGGGGGGGSVPSIQGSSPANFNIVGNSGTNQLIEGLTNSPMQAYVVAGQVTTAQSLERNQIKTATL